jgi:hypothetical protein
MYRPSRMDGDVSKNITRRNGVRILVLRVLSDGIVNVHVQSVEGL